MDRPPSLLGDDPLGRPLDPFEFWTRIAVLGAGSLLALAVASAFFGTVGAAVVGAVVCGLVLFYVLPCTPEPYLARTVLAAYAVGGVVLLAS